MIIVAPPLLPPPCEYVGPARALPWRYDTGGGRDAGGNACAERALTIATGLPRARIDLELSLAHSYKHDTAPTPGVWRMDVIGAVLNLLGWSYAPMRDRGGPCRVHLADLDASALLIVALEQHVTVLDHGVVVDKFNASDREIGVRECVSGTWRKR
jgi:hypothetical protein